jgi:riboflavin synthase
MFTGLVEAKGTLVRRIDRGREARLVVRGDLVDAPGGGAAPGRRDPIALGESIAVDGVCLTVDSLLKAGGPGPTTFEVDASSETLDRTTLGSLAPGAAVNLERAVAVGSRLGGHIVSGHVDGVGRVVALAPSGAALVVGFEAPAELARFIAPKGSICVSGVSLTVNGVSGSTFDVMLIPHTQTKTSLDSLVVGSRVNLEVDVLARYVARLLDPSSRTEAGATTDADYLKLLRTAGYA